MAEGMGEEQGLQTEWLYEQDGQVFGPLTTKTLLQRLYDGTMSPQTPVALEGGQFGPMSEIPAFRAHLPEVRARAEERSAERKRAAAEARQRLVRRTGWLAGGLVVVVLGSWAVMHFVRSQRRAAAERAQAEKAAALQAELDRLMASVTIEPPLEALVDERRARGRVRRRGSARSREASGPLTGREVMRGMRPAFRGLKRCIVKQIQRADTSVGDRIVLTFVIGNDGRARDVALADRFLRRSPMMKCFRRTLGTIRWRAFAGEVRNVEYPISVRR